MPNGKNKGSMKIITYYVTIPFIIPLYLNIFVTTLQPLNQPEEFSGVFRRLFCHFLGRYLFDFTNFITNVTQVL